MYACYFICICMYVYMDGQMYMHVLFALVFVCPVDKQASVLGCIYVFVSPKCVNVCELQ